MKTRKLGYLGIALFVLVTTLVTGCKSASNTIVVATDATWPPMERVNANKDIVGFDIDLMNAVAKEAGFKLEYKNIARDGIFAGIAAGKYDAIISSVTITDDRKKTIDFSDPYINAGQILVVQKRANDRT